jgi:hypothetical protein
LPLHGVEELIRHADVYSSEPKDLSNQFTPVPYAMSTSNRFFFMTCKRKNVSGTQSPEKPSRSPCPRRSWRASAVP